MGMAERDSGPLSRRRSSNANVAQSKPSDVRMECSSGRNKNQNRLAHPKVLSNSRAGSSESGESSKGSSSHTTNSVAMVDGFALFALAIQDNLRAKLTKLKSGGGEVSDQSLFSELRKLWEEKGEEQKLEWQCQANNVPSSRSGSHDSSSLNDEEDDDSQDSSGPSAGDRSLTGSSGSFVFRPSTRVAQHALPDNDTGELPSESTAAGSRRPHMAAILERLEKANQAATAAALPQPRQQPAHVRHLPYEPSAAQHSAAMRGTMADLYADGGQTLAFAGATGTAWSHAAREAALSSMSIEERIQLGEAMGGSAHAGIPLGLLGSIGFGGGGVGLEHALQLQRQQQQAAEIQNLYGLQGHSAAQYILMNQRLQGVQGLQGAGSLLPLHAALDNVQSRHLPSMILPSLQQLQHSNLYLQQPPAHHANVLHMRAQRDSYMLGQHSLPAHSPVHAQSSPSMNMYLPVTVTDPHSHLSTLQEAAHNLSMQYAVQQRDAMNVALSSAAGTSASVHACVHPWGVQQGGIEASLALYQHQQQMAAHQNLQQQQNLMQQNNIQQQQNLQQQQHLGVGMKRSFEKTEKSEQPDAEPPQVRTMTFVCDFFSPLEGQISLQILADTCSIITSGFGIVGLSCQLSSADGMRVVKRGQVKDARRHFAYVPTHPSPSLATRTHTHTNYP